MFTIVAAVTGAACGTTTAISPTPAPAPTAHTPPGWVVHVFQHTAIAVPASWTVVNEPFCPPSDNVGLLVLGNDSGAGCASGGLTNGPQVSVTALPSPASDAVVAPPALNCPVMVVNGLRVHVGPCGSSDPDMATWWTISALNVQLGATNSGGSIPESGTSTVVGKVLHTVHRATAAEVATRSPLVLRLSLDDTRVVSGVPIKAVVKVSNTTSVPILVQECAADGWLDVGLKGQAGTFVPAHVTPACAPTILLHPGITSVPETISTTYNGCAESPPSTPGDPLCVDAQPPPLPIGAYRTIVVTRGLPDDMIPANVVSVHLTR